MPYREASPALDQDFDRLVAALSSAPGDPALKTSAAALAHAVRGRCIDLASWKADLSPEYTRRVAQAVELTRLAGEHADDLLRQEFVDAQSSGQKRSLPT